jgi:hypothetical protein
LQRYEYGNRDAEGCLPAKSTPCDKAGGTARQYHQQQRIRKPPRNPLRLRIGSRWEMPYE